jgi:hypothetical protein
MQHTPHLSETLENLFKGKLKESSHVFLESVGPNAGLQRHVTFLKLGSGQKRRLLIIELNPDLKT